MSVLIKGMEMPCEEAEPLRIELYADGTVIVIKEQDDFYEFKAVPVPPHGRLIDVDYADDYAYDELEVANSYLTGWEAARAIQKIYQNAPTIIPADDQIQTFNT